MLRTSSLGRGSSAFLGASLPNVISPLPLACNSFGQLPRAANSQVEILLSLSLSAPPPCFPASYCSPSQAGIFFFCLLSTGMQEESLLPGDRKSKHLIGEGEVSKFNILFWNSFPPRNFVQNCHSDTFPLHLRSCIFSPWGNRKLLTHACLFKNRII